MNLAALLTRHKHDFLDQRTQFLGGDAAIIIVVQRIGEPLHPLAVDAGDVGMNVRRVGRCFHLPGNDLGLLAPQFVHARLHGWLIHAVLNGRDDPGDGLLDLCQRLAILLALRAALPVETVHFLGEGAHGFLDGPRGNQPVFQTGQHPFLDLVADDGPAVVAGAAPVMVQATIAVAHDEAVSAAAATASQQAGKKGSGPLLLMQSPGFGFPDAFGGRLEPDGNVLLAVSDCLPERIVHDAQMRNLGSDPLLGWVDARHALAGGRVLDEAQAVPYQNARIKLVVDDAGAARDMAPDAGVAPCPAKRAGNAIAIQIDGDSLGAFAGCELAEDAADNFRFLGDDLAVAPDRLAVTAELLHDAIAVAKPTARLAFLHPAPKTAMRLGGKVFEEQCVHRPLEADMKLGDFALSQGDDGDTCKFQMLVEGRHVCLIAADTVQRLGQEDVELAVLRIPHQPLDTGPQDRAGTGYGRILVGTDDLPPLPPRMFTAKPELVLNGRLALLLIGIAGVKSGAGHGGGLPRFAAMP